MNINLLRNLVYMRFGDNITKILHTAGYPLKLVIGVNEVPPKRRKSRTAFSVHQLTQLENRFRKQKYLTPSDRDQITKTLKLTSAQVPCCCLLKFI